MRIVNDYLLLALIIYDTNIAPYLHDSNLDDSVVLIELIGFVLVTLVILIRLKF